MTDQWCILRMAGPRTLAVAESLTEAGFEVWTPVKAIMRPAPKQRRALMLGLRRKMVEVDVAILPGFAFVAARSFHDILNITRNPFNGHPPFGLLQMKDRSPIIRESSLSGLRAEEAKAAEIAEEVRLAQSRQDARRLRAERMRTDKAKRKALRSERKDFAEGAEVMVLDMPAMQGMVGSVVKSTGKTARVNFGGVWEVEVEAWQLVPNALMDAAA